MRSKRQKCPVCGGESLFYRSFANEEKDMQYDYFQCKRCHCFFIDTAIIESMDSGDPLLQYDRAYWQNEASAAFERSYGTTLARMAEAFYYSRIPIHKFLDIGTGAGYFLDAVAMYLSDQQEMFYGIEKFPPAAEFRTSSKNYFTCGFEDLTMKFDGGICIEVIEHLTPKMLRQLLIDIARVSNKGALYIFNSGMSHYVKNEDPDYLDPFVRGHVMSWSLEGIKKVCEGLSFTALPIRGKSWAFALEFASGSNESEDITHRIWNPVEKNLQVLTDTKTGSVMRILGFETARAYQNKNLIYDFVQMFKRKF